MKSMMPEVARSLIGCKEHLGCADGVLRLFMDFDIFLPPGVGGLGGGGVIVLDAAVLHEYTGVGDILPGAYTHELGHNIGFGHDPYMLLANCGVDEGIYGELGYRLLNARAFQRTLDWLLKRESDRKVPWQPDPSVFAALRFFHGLGVHHKMFTERPCFRADPQPARAFQHRKNRQSFIPSPSARMWPGFSAPTDGPFSTTG